MKIYGITGWKNTGKTGLTERLVAEIKARGFTVSTIKHAHHSAQIDQPGRDSDRHRVAGAQEVIVASPKRWAIIHELRDAPEPPLSDLLQRLSPVDLVLIEGYKNASHPKVETHRAAAGHDLMAPQNTTIRAVASDSGATTLGLPMFDLNDTSAIADFILLETRLDAAQRRGTT